MSTGLPKLGIVGSDRDRVENELRVGHLAGRRPLPDQCVEFGLTSSPSSMSDVARAERVMSPTQRSYGRCQVSENNGEAVLGEDFLQCQRWHPFLDPLFATIDALMLLMSVSAVSKLSLCQQGIASVLEMISHLPKVQKTFILWELEMPYIRYRWSTRAILLELKFGEDGNHRARSTTDGSALFGRVLCSICTLQLWKFLIDTGMDSLAITELVVIINGMSNSEINAADLISKQ